MTCAGATSKPVHGAARKGRALRLRSVALACLIGLGLAACGPVPREQAERQCAARMKGVTNSPISGSGLLGINQDGHAIHDVDVNIRMATRMGSDPSALYQRCVYDRSGALPSRPYSSRQN